MTENGRNNKHKRVTCIIISFSVLLAAYVGISAYFSNHFFLGSSIGCVNISGETVDEAKKEMSSSIMAYTLNLKERGGKSEQIKASDIGMKYDSYEEVQSLKDKQSPFAWVSAFFDKGKCKVEKKATYDEELLKEKIDKLSCLDDKGVTEPQNPSFVYEKGKYTVVKEKPGNKIDKAVLYAKVEDAIVNGKNDIDLEAANCYVKPQYTSDSQKTIETLNILNKYVSAKITYSIGKKNEMVDGSAINKWIKIDNDFQITFDEKKVQNYMTNIFDSCNTVGKSRSFKTSSGKSISISGGDYGWLIDTSKEAQDLISDIKQGKTTSKEPRYSQTAFSSNGENGDIGNTYVEIDLSKQHLWFYQNGSLVVQGDVVTGNTSIGHSTPAGIYRLKYKQMNAVLRGPGYNAPVTFWMPFNGGIGLHDASWRSNFGGSIYKTDGSHGCVNAPYNVAKTVFNSIQPGTPIICY